MRILTRGALLRQEGEIKERKKRCQVLALREENRIK